MPITSFSSTTLPSELRANYDDEEENIYQQWKSSEEDQFIRFVRTRRSLSDVSDMDETNLYDRTDWPLSSPGPGKDGNIERTESSGADWEHHKEMEGSDVEEVRKASSEQGHDSIVDSSTIDQSIEDEDAERDAQVVRQSLYRSTAQDQYHPDIIPEQELLAHGEQSIPSGYVSPVQTPGLEDSERLLDIDQIRGASPVQQNLPRSGFATPISNDGISIGKEEELDMLTDLRTEERVDSITSNEGLHDNEILSSNITTPVATPVLASDDTWSPRSPAQPSTPQTNGHIRINSMLKVTPPSSNSKRSSIIYNTSQFLNNRGRVRYSWQSLQDDEPNRPRIHIIKLVSNTATASAGFPGGEAFGFSISPAGRRIAAYNSARLYVLQTAALPVGISQDYALKRRPLAVEIADEGDILAILADEHTINIYDMRYQSLRRTKTIKLDFPTNCMALAPTGGLLAVAYTGGLEVFSLDPNALPTDHRAVRSERMDRLTFSEDGSTLLGTTTRMNVSSTVIVSVPVFPSATHGKPTHSELKEAWCSDLLHPENIRNSSHATFLREKRTTCNERLFAWNGLADTFGILNVADMQYGNVDFPITISPPLSTCGGLGAAIHSSPAIDENGDTVAMIVNDRTIRLYIIPEQAGDDDTPVEAHSIDHELDEGYGCPFGEVRWVHSSRSLPAPINTHSYVQGRLIVTSPGGVVNPNMAPEEAVDDMEGGRIILFDFDPQFAGQPGQTFTLTLGRSPPQKLEEAQFDAATEVALVRRRTVNQSKGGGLSQRPALLGRAAMTYNGGRGLGRASPSPGMNSGLNSGRASVMSIHSMQSDAARSLPDLLETTETNELFEEPYAQNAPRSHASLKRASSNVQRHRFQTLEERIQERISTDSSGNFLPLPEYTEEPNAPLPSRFRALAGLDVPTQPASASGFEPMSAPAALAETFSSEQAFIAASGLPTPPIPGHKQAAAPTGQHIPTAPAPLPRLGLLPPLRTGTFDSTNSMPRSLQRAYSNAMSPIGHGPPPSLIGDWENVSPPISHHSSRTFAPSPSGTLMNGSYSRSAGTQEEPWDMISPVVPRGTTQPQPSYFRPPFHAQLAANPYRHSTSLLDPPGHFAPVRSATNYNNQPQSATERRMPPHMRAFREAAGQIPLRQPSSASPVGSVAHPVTAWHPPAPSFSAPPSSANRVPIVTQNPSAKLNRNWSRRSRVSNGSGRASPSPSSKRKGLFGRKKKRLEPFGPTSEHPSGPAERDSGSRMETRSMFTLKPERDSKCAMM